MSDELTFEFEVACSIEHAFETWTRKTSMWWPKTHSKSGDPGLTVTIEGRPNGRIFERTPAGVEREWGIVSEWDPPQRLSYLWHIYGEPADATEVEVAFIPRKASTLVRIVHRGFHRLGDFGADLHKRNLVGWEAISVPFAEACLRSG